MMATRRLHGPRARAGRRDGPGALEGETGDGFALKRIHPPGSSRVACRTAALQPYKLHVRYLSGVEVDKHDAYYFAPQLTDFDFYLFGEGNHYSIYYKLGAHPAELDGLAGTRFAVWAPNAEL